MQDTEMQDVVAVLNLEKELVGTVLKAIGAVGREAEKLGAFLIAALSKEKQLGKTSLKQILKKVVNQGGEIMFFQFDETRLKEFQKAAKKYGLLYSIAEDKNKNDGMMEIIFHSSHTNQVERVMRELGVGRVISEEEYINNGKEKAKDKTPVSAEEKIKKKDSVSKTDLQNTINDKKPKLIKEKLQEFDKTIQAKVKGKAKEKAKEVAGGNIPKPSVGKKK